MYRRTAHRGIAALALVLTLAIVGAQPAAAADRSSAARLPGFWEAVLDAVPGAHAVLDTLNRWLPFTEKSSSTAPDPASSDKGWGIDPNGIQVIAPAQPVSPASTPN